MSNVRKSARSKPFKVNYQTLNGGDAENAFSYAPSESIEELSDDDDIVTGGSALELMRNTEEAAVGESIDGNSGAESPSACNAEVEREQKPFRISKKKLFPKFFTLQSGNKASCNVCGSLLSTKNLHKSTGNFRRHYERNHKTVDLIGQRRLTFQKGGKIDSFITKDERIDFPTIMAEAMAESMLPFNLANKKRFQRMLLFPTKNVPSPSTVRRRIRSLYDEALDELVKQLALCESVSVSFDGWSRKGVHFLGVVVNYISDDKYNQRVGGFPELVNGQSGDQLAIQLLKILESLGIRSKVSAFVADNASNNAAAVRLLADRCSYYLNGALYSPFLLPCFDHITNIIAMHLIDNINLGDSESSGPITRMREFVVNLHKLSSWKLEWKDVVAQEASDLFFSDQTRETEESGSNAMPPLDCPTRWNSLYDMLSGVIKSRSKITALGKRVDFVIESKEWKVFEDLKFILEPFKRASLLAARSTDVVSASFLLQGLARIGKLFLEARMSSDLKAAHLVSGSFPNLSSDTLKAIVASEPKFIKYVEKSLTNKGVVMAALLDPRMKEEVFSELKYFYSDIETIIKQGKEEIQRLTESVVCNKTTIPRNSSMAPDEELRAFFERKPVAQSEMARYFSSPCDMSFGRPRDWWDLNKQNFPAMYTLATKMLSIPASSTTVERLFSVSKKVIVETRSSLGSDTAKELLVLRDYLRSKGDSCDPLDEEDSDFVTSPRDID